MDVFIGTQCTFNKVEIIRNAVIEETGTPALTGQFKTCQSCLNCRSVWWLSSCNIIYVLLVCFLRYSPVSGHFTLPRPPYCVVMDMSSYRPMGASVARLIILISGARSRSWN